MGKRTSNRAAMFPLPRRCGGRVSVAPAMAAALYSIGMLLWMIPAVAAHPFAENSIDVDNYKDGNNGMENLESNSQQQSDLPPISCRKRCPVIIEPDTLQQCVDLCKSDGQCCGNRIDLEFPEKKTSKKRLSCANGCEIAFYSDSVDSCKAACVEGKDGKRFTWYPFEDFRIDFVKDANECKEDPTCPHPARSSCNRGCELANGLPAFYNQPNDNSNANSDGSGNGCDDAAFLEVGARFLFAGQSNMEGHSNQAMQDLFYKTIQIVNEKFEVEPPSSPGDAPSGSPSDNPSDAPSNAPTASPTESPTGSPSSSPSNTPSGVPTMSPTESPTGSPNDTPSSTPPTYSPTGSPSDTPSETPSTASPTKSPTSFPSSLPSIADSPPESEGIVAVRSVGIGICLADCEGANTAAIGTAMIGAVTDSVSGSTDIRSEDMNAAVVEESPCQSTSTCGGRGGDQRRLQSAGEKVLTVQIMFREDVPATNIPDPAGLTGIIVNSAGDIGETLKEVADVELNIDSIVSEEVLVSETRVPIITLSPTPTPLDAPTTPPTPNPTRTKQTKKTKRRNKRRKNTKKAKWRANMRQNRNRFFRRMLGENTEDEERNRIEAKLTEVILQARSAKEFSARREAELMYLLAGESKNLSPLNNETIFIQNPSVFCSFTDPRLEPDTSCERPVSPRACGAARRNYGPELMFSHIFPTLETKYKGMTLGITKVSSSGSNIDEWLKDSGTEKNYWESLRKNIHADNGTIEAFFWYQGEDNMFQPEPLPRQMDQEEYLNKLTKFVDDVRQEIFASHLERWGETGSPTATFGSKADIPVVIVELGAWIGNGERGPGNIILAQREYVSNIDSNSILVNAGTNDDPNKRLSHFYHQDAPTYLIIGDNLAKGFESLLNKNS